MSSSPSTSPLGSGRIEELLREALAPVEPPPELASRLTQRLELSLAQTLEQAADELETWELRAMKDPRNWVRPAVATAAGSAAAVGLAVLRARHRARGLRRR